MWVKKCVEMCVMLFKMWKCEFEKGYQTGPRFPFKLNQVLWTRFPLNQTESNELDFCAYVDQMSTSTMRKSSMLYSIYNFKIESFGLELLDVKLVTKLC